MATATLPRAPEPTASISPEALKLDAALDADSPFKLVLGKGIREQDREQCFFAVWPPRPGRPVTALPVEFHGPLKACSWFRILHGELEVASARHSFPKLWPGDRLNFTVTVRHPADA